VDSYIDVARVTIGCPVCGGEGVIPDPADDEAFLDIPCPLCDGEGWVEGETDEATAD
jgi:hypothetical protein